MGTDYYLVCYEEKRALVCDKWYGLGMKCRGGPVTQPMLDEAQAAWHQNWLYPIASRWLSERASPVVVMDDSDAEIDWPWVDEHGVFRDDRWVLDSPWEGKLSEGEVRYPPTAP